ncbi:hypothetical protein KSP39_PZI000795 [Platanthera zijinensis]|uniref:Uncharacterized protein n=1 Tax=Platanthera zijinensis TaxID=2320716 RepID=A0AAP0GG16_9ASPA
MAAMAAALILVAAAAIVAGDFTSDRAEYTEQLTAMLPCLVFVEGEAFYTFVRDRRIAEGRVNEMTMALEEMMYALVVQKFVESDVALILVMSQPFKYVDRWSPKEEKLEQLNSLEGDDQESSCTHSGIEIGELC